MNVEKIIVLGLSPTAKYVGKEAYNFNIKCMAFDFKKGAAFYSKYFEEKKVLREQELLKKLKTELLNNGTTYYICPTSDEWIEFINKNKELFINTNLKTSKSYLNGDYNLLADKFELLKVAKSCDLHYPESIVFTPSKEDVPSLSELEFPVFVKPSNRAGLAHIMKGKKGWLFNNVKEWQSFNLLEELKNVELLIQEVIIGDEANIKVLGTVSDEGISVEKWVGIKYRQYPHGFGSASLVIETFDEELEDITNILLKETKYTGFFALETKYCDKREKTYLIEVNTRPGLWFGATTTANCNFVIKWFAQLGGHISNIKLLHEPRESKVVWRYAYKDFFISIIKRNRLPISIKKIGKTVNSYAVFDAKDLKPFVFDFFNGIRKLIRS